MKVFQFHKVRLKDPFCSFGASGKMFQFHKVRLKALEDAMERD